SHVLGLHLPDLRRRVTTLAQARLVRLRDHHLAKRGGLFALAEKLGGALPMQWVMAVNGTRLCHQVDRPLGLETVNARVSLGRRVWNGLEGKPLRGGGGRRAC